MKCHFVRPVPLAAATIAACASIPVLAQAEPDGAPVATLTAVTVEASADASAQGLLSSFAGGQVVRGGRVGLLGNLDFMDTPFNSTAYTGELIKDQQAASIADIVQNDPSVRVARGFGNYQQLYMVRGFPLYSDDITYNGLYGLLPRQYLASEFIERLEVFRGANTFLNGAAPGSSGIGGAINVVPKRAPSQALSQLTLGWESGGQGYAAADLARRFGPDQSTGVRINAVRRSGGTAVEGEGRELGAFGIGLDWHGERTRLSADIGYQNHKLDRNQASVTIGGGLPIPGAPDASVNLAPSYTYSNERDLFGTIRGEYDISTNLTAWAAVGARRGDESSTFSNPTVNDLAGNTTAMSSSFARKDTVRTAEVGLRGNFQTGSVGHTINASAALYDFDSRQAYVFYEATASNLYRPIDAPRSGSIAFSGGSLDDPLVTERTRTASVAIADTMSFAQDRVLLTVGLRHQRIRGSSYDYDTGDLNPPVNDKSRLTPVAGVVVKASESVSLYANYIESLAKVPAASGSPPPLNAGQLFEPFHSKQKEIGVKYDTGKLGGSLALFTTNQPTAHIDEQTNLYGIYGEQRNRGAELMVFGEPVRGFRVLGGLTLLDAEQRRTQGGATDGKRAIGVARAQANLGAEWDVPGVNGLTLTGRVVHTSPQYADAANTQKVPAWTRFDLGARYLTEVNGRLLTLRARVDNVANKNYWASAGGYPGSGYLVLGAPRTFVLSASMDF